VNLKRKQKIYYLVLLGCAEFEKEIHEFEKKYVNSNVYFKNPCWLSSAHSDLDSTQIVTRHCNAKSQTISQLVNSGTISTRQVPIVQPFQVIETPADGVSAHATPPSNNPDRTMWLH
jgi:hypothetical protein